MTAFAKLDSEARFWRTNVVWYCDTGWCSN